MNNINLIIVYILIIIFLTDNYTEYEIHNLNYNIYSIIILSINSCIIITRIIVNMVYMIIIFFMTHLPIDEY